ncbi:hypothetical protein B5S31_g1941 [[Candida] boidinii]|nr:hypothetical protein B5S31_g1941 [[Candida] boidinii]
MNSLLPSSFSFGTKNNNPTNLSDSESHLSNQSNCRSLNNTSSSSVSSKMNNKSSNHHLTHIHHTHNSIKKLKRRISDDDQSILNTQNSNRQILKSKLKNHHNHHNHTHHTHHAHNNRQSSSIMNLKRQKDLNNIKGTNLSTERIIETLDKSELQLLIKNLINENPELNSKILNLSPKITIKNSIDILNNKLNLILNNLPYKVNPISDYSFLRVKSFINDFFQTLSYYTLNFLPPVENDLIIPLKFLIEFLLNILHKLPNFEAIEFKYYYKLTIEKFNTIFFDVLSNYISENRNNILNLINENYLNQILTINELNNNNFIAIYDFLKGEIDQFNSNQFQQLQQQQQQQENLIIQENSNNSHDLKNSNDSNKLQGIEALLNLSAVNNSQLHGNVI